MKWNNKHLRYEIKIIKLSEKQVKYYHKEHHKNARIVVTEVSGMKTLMPLNFTYQFSRVKEIIRLLCEATEGGKPEVEKELGIKIK